MSGTSTPRARSRAGPALDDGTLYVGDYAGQMYALRASRRRRTSGHVRTSGARLRPRRAASTRRPRSPSGASSRGTSTAASTASTLDSGELAWTPLDRRLGLRRPRGRRHARTPADRLRRLQDQNFFALDAETGDVRWQKRPSAAIIARRRRGARRHRLRLGLGPNIGTFGFDVKTGEHVYSSTSWRVQPGDLGRQPHLPDRDSNVRRSEAETEASADGEAERQGWRAPAEGRAARAAASARAAARSRQGQPGGKRREARRQRAAGRSRGGD